MKKFIQTIKDIWIIEELRNKILLTLGLMAIYRFAAQVPLPGFDTAVAQQALQNQTSGGGLLGILDMFTGGAFSQASVVARSIRASRRSMRNPTRSRSIPLVACSRHDSRTQLNSSTWRSGRT